MGIRRLKTIAVVFGLTVATLASEDVSPALAKQITPFDPYLAFIHARKAFGGAKVFNTLSSSDQGAIIYCTAHDWCMNHFEGKLRPDNLDAVRAKIKDAGVHLP
jgi:hypothetical protein